MATNTTNYGLEKPAQVDFYNVDVFNRNADTVDAALKNNVDLATSAKNVADTNQAQITDMANSRRNYIRNSGNYIVGGSVGGIAADTGIAVEVCNGYIRFANTAGATGKNIYFPLSEELAAGLTLTLQIRCRRRSTNTSTINSYTYSSTGTGVGPFNGFTPTSEFTTYIATTTSQTTGISGRARFSSTNFPNAGDTLDIANIALYEGTVLKAVWQPAPEDVGDMDKSVYDTDGDGIVDFTRRRYTNFIASGTDLNTLKQGGMLYVCGQYSIAVTLSNCPVTDAFAMETYRTVAGSEALANGDSNLSVLQRLYTYYDTTAQQIWQRAYYHGSGAWSEWYQIYHSGNIPSATTSQKGIVQLYDGTDSGDTGKAATAAAVKAAKDSAQTALSSATEARNTANTALTLAGSAQAVADTAQMTADAAQANAESRATINHASTNNTYGVGTGTLYGHLRLSESVSSANGASNGYAATPSAVKSAYDLAAAAVPKTGGTMTGQLAVSSGGLVVGSVSGSLGTYAMTQGTTCSATGSNAFASGTGCTASGTAAMAQGSGADASGAYAHARGSGTSAVGTGASAMGMGTMANGYLEIAGGRWNVPSSYSGTVWSSLGNALVLGNGTNLGTANSFRVNNSGAVYALSAFNSSGADYAEYFEWVDGNPDGEDRIGHFVTLDGGKIRIANGQDTYILGIVSAVPGVIGNSYEDAWQGMYLKDEWGRLKYEDVGTENGNEYRLAQNPNYDISHSYVPRSRRPEWTPIGLLGQLLVFCEENCRVGGFCMPNDAGHAIAAESGYRILETNEGIARVLFR